MNARFATSACDRLGGFADSGRAQISHRLSENLETNIDGFHRKNTSDLSHELLLNT